MKHTKLRLLLTSACLLVTLAVAGEGTNAPVFQLRLVAESRFDDPGPRGPNEFTLLDKKSGKTYAEVLLLEKTILLDQTALDSAEVTTNSQSGQSEISITFTEEDGNALPR